MADSKTKSFNIEKIFTRKDYAELKQAIDERREYEFRYGNPNTYLPHPTTGIYFKVDGHICDNSVWKDNYLYGFNTWRNNGGVCRGFDPVDEVLTYEELISNLYGGLNLNPPRKKQMSFFDFEV